MQYLSLNVVTLFFVAVTEEFDWLTNYTLAGKFPPDNYRCLPSLFPRMTITDNGDFITNGLLLEDERKYVCSSESLDGFFVFRPIIQGET